jgi:hypothetical protein
MWLPRDHHCIQLHAYPPVGRADRLPTLLPQLAAATARASCGRCPRWRRCGRSGPPPRCWTAPLCPSSPGPPTAPSVVSVAPPPPACAAHATLLGVSAAWSPRDAALRGQVGAARQGRRLQYWRLRNEREYNRHAGTTHHLHTGGGCMLGYHQCFQNGRGSCSPGWCAFLRVSDLALVGRQSACPLGSPVAPLNTRQQWRPIIDCKSELAWLGNMIAGVAVQASKRRGAVHVLIARHDSLQGRHPRPELGLASSTR